MHRISVVLSAIFLAVSAPMTAAQTVQAVPSAGLDERAPALYNLLDAVGIYDVLAMAAVENQQDALSLEADMFPGQGGAAWSANATRIYSADRIVALFEDALGDAPLAPVEISTLATFFESELGQRIVAGELAARRAFMDVDAEEVAQAALVAAIERGEPRLAQLEEFNTAIDLVNRNVTIALNGAFRFYQGLSDGGAFDVEVPDELMLAEVAGREAELRRAALEWLFSYQLLAYSELSDDELETYIALVSTPAGQTLNRVMFDAFASVFATLNFELGEAAAGFIAADDV